MIADDLRYSDRDVRDNPGVLSRVVEYLKAYTGEFDYLVDCKRRVENGDDLSVGMIRGVLNCMRNDPRVIGLPTPSGLSENVVEFRPRRTDRAYKSDRKDMVKLRDCDITEYHGEHGGAHYEDAEGFDGYRYCHGIHQINREDFWIEAKLKVPYIMPKTVGLVHKVGDESVLPKNGEDHYVAWYMWRVKAHAYGWSREEYEFLPVTDLYVRTACKYPRYLENPRLIAAENLTLARTAMVSKGLCPRCFPDGFTPVL